ncbi:MAG: membrane protease YdiL (CAAX protease family) [Myxococcota bacterium]|jgi:membrane protease YdiL (CAAX protease family)
MDTLRWALTGSDGGLRAGWRLVAHAALMVAALVVGVVGALVLAVAASMLAGGEPGPVGTTALYALSTTWLCVGLIAAHAVSGWVIDARWVGGFQRGKIRYSALGGPAGRAALEGLGGVAMGLAALAVAVAIVAMAGIEVTAELLDARRFAGFLLGSALLIPAAAVEELLFRGYGFLWAGRCLAGVLSLVLVHVSTTHARRLANIGGFGTVIVATATAFGLVHGMNPGVTLLSTANTVLAGLWFGVLVVRTRTLWVAIGAHWSWNWAQGLLLGLPISGTTEDSSGLVLTPLARTLVTAEPEWLSGGAYGIEGSIATSVAMVIAIAISAVLPSRAADNGASALRWPPPTPGD